nr:MAG: putative tail-component [Bacteriophage sp.]
MDGMEFDGADDLISGVENALKKYPDLVEDGLKKERKDFNKDMVKETWRAVDKHTGNLVRGFRFSKIRANKYNMETDFLAEGSKKGAHFHLVNNGHEMVTVVSRNKKKVQGGGKTVGFVPGRRIKEPVIERWNLEHGRRAEKMLEKIHEEIDK